MPKTFVGRWPVLAAVDAETSVGRLPSSERYHYNHLGEDTTALALFFNLDVMRNTEDILMVSLIGGILEFALFFTMSYAGLKKSSFKKHWYWFLLATAFCCIPIYFTLQGVCIYLYPIKVKGVVYDSSHTIKGGWSYHVRYLYDGEIRFTSTGENCLYSTENGDSCTVYISKWFPDDGRVVRE